MPHVASPVVTHDDELFWTGVADGKLLLTRCARCRHLQHPPSPMCPNCGSLDWDAEEASGRGTVHSWIVSHHPTAPDDAHRIVALIQLEEGVRIVSNLQAVDPSEVRNDMPVEALFMTVDEVRLLQFRPTAVASS
ncbi:MAG: Zn-ribbon domain-containing OB-fold protein [Acidimicrobiales bacterium]